jgi:putative hydroxymethylpyrimidine transport system substrate-binding protein
VVAILVVLALMTVACGDDDGGGSSVETTSTTMSAVGETTTSSAEAELTVVRMVMEFPLSSPLWSPTLVAQQRGYYADEGIEVVIIPPTDTADTSKILGTGGADVAYGTMTDVVLGRSIGVSVAAVGNYSVNNNCGIIALEEFTLPDLQGKIIGIPADAFTSAQLEAALQGAGMSMDDVQIVATAGAREALLLSGDYDAISGCDNGELLSIEVFEQTDAYIEYYRDYGVPDTPVWVYEVNTDWLDANPDLAQGWFDATRRGLEDALADPQLAVDAYYAAYPGDSGGDEFREFWDAFWAATAVLIEPVDPLMTLNLDEWEELAQFFEDHGLIEEALPASDYVRTDLQGG